MTRKKPRLFGKRIVYPPFIIGGLAILFICVFSSCKTSIEYVGGIQINEPDQDEWANTLMSSGMNTAQVTAYAKQGAWNSDHLWWEKDDTTHLIKEIRTLKDHGLKVVLVLRISLQHSFEENGYKWHGMIYPIGRAQQDEWFYRYKYFVGMWAEICQREEVDVFAISSEMNALTATRPITELPSLIDYMASTDKQTTHLEKLLPYETQLSKFELWDNGKLIDKDIRSYISAKIASNVAWAQTSFLPHDPLTIKINNQQRSYLDSNWRDIISHARSQYDGKITMASNFDNYQEVSFWDELDFIGVNAYFPLRNVSREILSQDSLYKELVEGWQRVFKEFREFTDSQNLKDQPIIFTEIGYTKKQNCTVVPWAGTGFNLLRQEEGDTLLIWQEVSENPKERILAFKALHEVIDNEKVPLIGLNYWKFSTKEYHAKHEPFMLHINEDNSDSLQSGLSRFLNE